MKLALKQTCVALGVLGISMTSQNAQAFKFGDDWKVNDKDGVAIKCKQLDKNKKLIASHYLKHAGLDIMYPAGRKVKVLGNLYYYTTYQYGYWKDGVIACTILKNGVCDATNEKNVFYNFMHLDAAKLKAGQSLKDVQIGTIGDLDTNSHLHFSKRVGAYLQAPNIAGALPPNICNDYTYGTRKGLPDYQEKFVDPSSDTGLFQVTK